MKMFLFLAVIGAAASSASASMSVSPVNGNGFYTLDGQYLPGSTVVNRSPAGTTYGVFTGLATATGGLALIEPTAPAVRDDIVNFDGTAELINDYVAVAGGITRSVNESVISNGLGGFDIRVLVTGSGNLFPAGFSSGGNALTGAGVGLGIGLPAALGGADPLFFTPGNEVSIGILTLRRASGAESSFNLPLSFFGGAGNPWNGIVGVSVNNVATTANATDPFVEVQWDLRTIPAPSALALIGLGGLVATRRRRA